MRGRHARVSARVALSIALGVVLLSGGAAFAAYRYDSANTDRILPGVRVEGIDLDGMTREEAIAAVEEAAETALERSVEVRAAGETWRVTAEELGTTTDIEAKVREALAVSGELSWPSRVYHRLLGGSLDRDMELEYRPDQAQVERFVEVVGRAIRVSPENAAITLVDGKVVLRKPQEGRVLQDEVAREALTEALLSGGETVDLSVRTTRPKITGGKLGHTIVVRLSKNKLYLYKDLKRVKTFGVATGAPGFPTPQGEFEIVDKVENPSWTNPAPDGWGASMPRYIPPGPSNPLGTRALYLNSPGIRIHGTSADYSIGTYASHGCIRMHRWDVEELFEIVPKETPVLIVW